MVQLSVEENATALKVYVPVVGTASVCCNTAFLYNDSVVDPGDPPTTTEIADEKALCIPCIDCPLVNGSDPILIRNTGGRKLVIVEADEVLLAKKLLVGVQERSVLAPTCPVLEFKLKIRLVEFSTT